MEDTIKVVMIVNQEIIEINNDGGKQCSLRNYRLLCDAFGENNVQLIMYSNYNSSEEERIIRINTHRNSIERLLNIMTGRLFISKQNEEQLIKYLLKENPRMIFLDRSLYGSLVRKIKKSNLKSKIWVYIHNIEKEYFRNKFKNKLIIKSIICHKIDKSEYDTIINADCILGLTERDAKKIEQIYSRNMKYIIPACFQDIFENDKKEKKMNEDKVRLMFVGSNFAPNYEGIKWFVEEVMTELSDAELLIVGKDFEKVRNELTRDNVKVIGTVDDLSKYYYKDSIMVMPIFWGDGQKIKVAESMMYGKIIIATNEALEGYDVEGVNGIYRCNTKEEFLKAINSIKESKEYEKYENNVRTLFLDKYSMRAIYNQIIPLIKREMGEIAE